MILAAGYGTRLWPLTIDRAKPAIPFMGRPLVGYVAEYLARFGCTEVAVNLHHRPESVRAALGDGSRFGVRLEYVLEPEILGTSGALDNARYFFERETFVVVNGKIATDIDLGLAFETHRRSGALATLVLQRNEARERFSTVEVEDGLVTGFGGMPSKNDAGGEVPLMFTGIQILEPCVFDYIPRGKFSHTTTDVYLPAIARGERVAAHVAGGYWYELSTIPRYLEISLALMKREGVENVVGEGATIEPGADVRDAVLWEGARVERGARVRRAVLGAGVRVAAGEVLEDAAVVRAELVAGEEPPPKALAGEVRGANFVVPLGG
jgi:NDP-sugar pyrophosphorylase family protein